MTRIANIAFLFGLYGCAANINVALIPVELESVQEAVKEAEAAKIKASKETDQPGVQSVQEAGKEAEAALEAAKIKASKETDQPGVKSVQEAGKEAEAAREPRKEYQDGVKLWIGSSDKTPLLPAGSRLPIQLDGSSTMRHQVHDSTWSESTCQAMWGDMWGSEAGRILDTYPAGRLLRVLDPIGAGPIGHLRGLREGLVNLWYLTDDSVDPPSYIKEPANVDKVVKWYSSKGALTQLGVFPFITHFCSKDWLPQLADDKLIKLRSFFFGLYDKSRCSEGNKMDLSATLFGGNSYKRDSERSHLRGLLMSHTTDGHSTFVEKFTNGTKLQRRKSIAEFDIFYADIVSNLKCFDSFCEAKEGCHLHSGTYGATHGDPCGNRFGDEDDEDEDDYDPDVDEDED